MISLKARVAIPDNRCPANPFRRKSCSPPTVADGRDTRLGSLRLAPEDLFEVRVPRRHRGPHFRKTDTGRHVRADETRWSVRQDTEIDDVGGDAEHVQHAVCDGAP